MSAVLHRLVARLLERAVGRWPTHLRDDLAREWAAELHALDHEAGVPAPARTWRQLRFAASLAVAPPPGAGPAPLYWLSQVAPGGAQLGWLLLAPLLTALATAVAWIPLLLVPFGWIQYTPRSVALLSIETFAIQAGLAVLIGTLLGRRFLRHRSGHPASPAGCAWTALPLISGLIIVDLLVRAANQVWAASWSGVVAALCLTALLPPAVAAVAALSSRRRRGLAVGIAGLAAPVLTLAVIHVVVLLAPHRLAPETSQPWSWLTYLYQQPALPVTYVPTDGQLSVEGVLPVLSGLVLITVVLALAHAVRLARPLPATLAAVPPVRPARRAADDLPAVARSPWWHRTALAGAAYSVMAWAVTLTYLTPNIGVQSSWPSRQGSGGRLLPEQPAGWPEWTSEEGRLWMHELQLSSIICAALCLVYAAAYRGRPVLPAVTGAAVLLGVNMVVVREDWITPRLLPWLAGGGLLLGIAAWSAASWLAAGWGRPRRPRRLVITITILAAFLVPGSFLPRFYVQEGLQAPPVLLLVVVGLPTVLTVLAGMGVLATTRRPRRGPAWRLPAGLALLPAVGGVLFYQDGVSRMLPDGGNPFSLLVFAAPVALAVPVIVWTAAAIRARPASARRTGLRMLAAPLLLAAGYPLAMITGQTGNVLSRTLLFPMEYGQTYDGIELVPGALVIGLLLGYLTAIRLDRTGPEPVPAPASNGHIDLGYARPEPA